MMAVNPRKVTISPAGGICVSWFIWRIVREVCRRQRQLLVRTAAGLSCSAEIRRQAGSHKNNQPTSQPSTGVGSGLPAKIETPIRKLLACRQAPTPVATPEAPPDLWERVPAAINRRRSRLPQNNPPISQPANQPTTQTAFLRATKCRITPCAL